MSPYFRAFLFFVVACMVAALFGVKVLAAEPVPVAVPAPQTVLVYVTDGTSFGVTVMDVLAAGPVVACFAVWQDLPTMRCMVRTGEIAGGITFAEWMPGVTVVPAST